jgi:hypothetical protein
MLLTGRHLRCTLPSHSDPLQPKDSIGEDLMRHKSIVVVMFIGVVILVTNFSILARQTPQNTSAPATTSVPRLITYSGALRDANGLPITSVTSLRFAVYKDQYDGAPIWTEVQNVQPDQQGSYAILLGAYSDSGLPTDLFSANESRWLGVQTNVPGATEQPRVLLVSVPYALRSADADTLGGRPASAYMLAPSVDLSGNTAQPYTAQPNTSQLSVLQPGVATFASTSGDAGYIGKFVNSTDLGDSVIFQSGSSVGINTISPLAPLQAHLAPNVNFAMDPGNGPGAARLDAFNDAANANIPIEIQGSTVSLFGAGGAFGMAVNNVGNVGVGTTNPLAKFQTHLGPNVNFAMDPGNGPGAARLDAFNDAANANTPIEIQGSTVTLFGAGGALGLSVNSSGNVGVGKTNPAAALDVNGTAKVNTIQFGDSTTMTTAGATLGSNTFAGGQTLASGNLAVNNGSIITSTNSGIPVGASGLPTVSAAIVGGNSASSSTNVIAGVIGQQSNSQGDGAGVIGISTNMTPGGTGVVGIAYGQNSIGVVANNQNPTGVGFSVQMGPNFSDALDVYGDGAAGKGKVAIGGGIGSAIGFSTLTARAEQSFQATGTVSVTSGSTLVTGTGTQFGAEFGVNDRVTINGQTIPVGAVFSNTSMAVLAPFNSSANNVTATNFPNVFRVDDVNGAAQFAVSWDGFTTVGGPGHLAKFAIIGNDSTTTGRGAAAQIANVSPGGGTWVLRSGATGTTTPAGGFSISNNDTPAGYRLVIDSTGRVGIGATAPTQALEVNGGIRLNTATARPACDATVRGTFWVTQGGTGVADSVQVCAKDAADSYAWRTIF